MDMTHPAILRVEKTGYPPQTHEPVLLGRCLWCKSEIYSDWSYVNSNDGDFCDRKCCDNYYGIKVMSEEQS